MVVPLLWFNSGQAWEAHREVIYGEPALVADFRTSLWLISGQAWEGPFDAFYWEAQHTTPPPRSLLGGVGGVLLSNRCCQYRKVLQQFPTPRPRAVTVGVGSCYVLLTVKSTKCHPGNWISRCSASCTKSSDFRNCQRRSQDSTKIIPMRIPSTSTTTDCEFDLAASRLKSWNVDKVSKLKCWKPENAEILKCWTLKCWSTDNFNTTCISLVSTFQHFNFCIFQDFNTEKSSYYALAPWTQAGE